MSGSRKASISRQTRLFDDFFKIDEVFVSHQQHDGTMSAEQRRLIFERGDSVAVLLYEPETHSVITVNQFKVPSLIARRRDNPVTTDGWITEAIAGMIDGDESPEEAVVRETLEETGYKIKNPELICRFFSSPGGTSERIFLYFAQVKSADLVGKGGGLDGEDVKVVRQGAHELFEQLAKKEIEDPKLVIAAYWLQNHIRQMKPLEYGTVSFELKEKPGLIVGYKTGQIDDVKGVSIWVNSENTDMMMDRFIGKSISAKIRYLGANKEEESVLDDTIQESLRSVVGERAHVKIGTVLVTESGMLFGSNQVQRIFHVATVEGGAGIGVKADADKMKHCVEQVLRRVDQENQKLRRILWKNYLTSILFPMFGAGEGGLSTDTVAQTIIPAAVNYLAYTPNSALKEIYFLAFKPPDKSACDRALESLCAKGLLRRRGAG